VRIAILGPLRVTDAGGAPVDVGGVSRLRRALPGVVEAAPTGYRLGLPPKNTDVYEFERLAAAGRRALAPVREPAEVPRAVADVLRRALAFPAVRLFAQRAAAVRPGFAATVSTVDAAGGLATAGADAAASRDARRGLRRSRRCCCRRSAGTSR
jgi:hypothetical protein